MKTAGLIAAWLVSFSGAIGFGADLSSQNSNSIQSTCAELMKVKCFAFGGVGYAGATSKGEIAFHAVLASTNALELFNSVLSRGTDEAKLYALCGIRSLQRESFDSAAKPLLAADPRVNTMSGCLLAEEKASAVIRRIAEGAYDSYGKR